MTEAHPLVTIEHNKDQASFERFCQTPACSENIKIFINDGCDVNKLNPKFQKRPIDFAVESLCKENIEALLTEPTVNIDKKCAAWSGMTPVNFLATKIEDYDFEKVFSCIQTLIEYFANVNQPDDKRITPIWRILVKRELNDLNKRTVLTYLLENATGIDIDNYQNGDIRRLLAEQFPDIKLPIFQINDEKWDFGRLASCLTHRQEMDFLKGLNHIAERHEDDLNALFRMDENRRTLLILAAENGLTKAVARLLRLGADINYTPRGQFAPIEFAIKYGYWEVLEIFLRSVKVNTQHALIRKVLMQIHSYNGEPVHEKNLTKCFEILIGSPKMDVDLSELHTDTTALDVAVEYLQNKPHIISSLLEKGAYIGSSQANVKPSISNIDPKLLEHHFDNCITSVDDTVTKHPEIQFNYMNLIPIASKQSKGVAYSNEMQSIVHISKYKELRYLLKHPLIQSFLFLKWQRLVFMFYVNLFMFLLFTASVLSYILSLYIDLEEGEGLRWFFYSSIFMTAVMILRELCQFILSPYFYVRNPQNYLEIILLGLVTFILYDDPNVSYLLTRISERIPFHSYYIAYNHDTIAVIFILLLTAELIILLGSMEKFFIHFIMLKSVLMSFIKALTLYMVIFAAFALCFFALLSDPDKKKGDLSSFESVGLSLIKVFIMSTGEFDAANINFDSKPIRYLLFVVFLFLVPMVLFNLLNGLAVSDIQKIRSEAELTNLMRRVDLLYQYESILCSKHLWCHPFAIKWIDPYRLSIFKLLPMYKIKVELKHKGLIYESPTAQKSRVSRLMSGKLFKTRMPSHIVQSTEQILRKRKMDELPSRSDQFVLCDRISQIEKALFDSSSKLDPSLLQQLDNRILNIENALTNNAQKLDSLLLVLSSSKSSKIEL